MNIFILDYDPVEAAEALKSENAAESYRNYCMTKRSFCNCTKREIPQ